MSENKHCTECKITTSTKFRSLKREKWREAERNDLIKETWMEGDIFCNICYMNFVENPLKRGLKKVKIMDKESVDEEIDEEAIGEVIEEEVSMKIDFTGVIKVMAKILYEREHLKKESPIYTFDEMRRLLQGIEPSLEDFFDQLYLVARPSK
ncbi:6460_t:CDS:1, partial [Ambispora gerdemannii]